MNSDPELSKKLLDNDDVDDDDVITVDVDTDEEQQNFIKPNKSRRSKSSRPTIRSNSGGCPCWCKCILITLALSSALGIFLTMATYMYMQDIVQHLTVTSSEQLHFPVVDMTDEELMNVQDRIEHFVDQLIDGNGSNDNNAEPLIVTQDEINGFLGHSDYLRGNMMVTLTKNSIQEQYSLPTWMLPGGTDRYFVGQDHLTLEQKNDEGDSGTVEFELETAAKHHDWFDGPLVFAQLSYLVKNHKEGTTMLDLYLEKGSFFGQAAPADFIDQRQNLLEQLYDSVDCEDARAILNGIESVSIEDGQIVIRLRPRPRQPKKDQYEGIMLLTREP